MDISRKRKPPRNIKLPDYSKYREYEPLPTAKQELDYVWDGETLSSDSETGKT